MGNYHSDEWIINRVHAHYEYLQRFYAPERILGIFYKGSANYGIDTEVSDVDTIAVVLSPIKDLIDRNKISQEITFDNEIISVYDIKQFTILLLKSNWSILQILYTKYKIVNYPFFWKMLTNKKDAIATYNLTRLYQAFKGEACTFYTKTWITNKETSLVIDYNAKEFAKVLKLHYLVKILNQGYSYEKTFHMESEDTILKALTHAYDVNTAQLLAQAALKDITTICNQILEKKIPANTEIINYIDNWCYQMECWYLKQTDWGLLYD